MITEEKYYNLMCGEMGTTFKEIHKNWYDCFHRFLNIIDEGFTDESIQSLFYDFDMENWGAMHKENTEYSECTDEELLDDFLGECSYICDRMSYDRLFRTHWLFRNVFYDELNKVRFPEIFN